MSKFWSNIEWWLIGFGMVCFAIADALGREWVVMLTHASIAVIVFELGIRRHD